MPPTNSSCGCQFRLNSVQVTFWFHLGTSLSWKATYSIQSVGRQTGRWEVVERLLKGGLFGTAKLDWWIHQVVLFTPAHTDCFMPWAAWTAFQFRRVLGTSSSASGVLRAPSAGRATTMGKGPHSRWNSTTFNCFRSARVW